MSDVEAVIISYAILLAMASSDEFSSLSVTLAWALAGGYLIYLARQKFNVLPTQGQPTAPMPTAPAIPAAGSNG